MGFVLFKGSRLKVSENSEFRKTVWSLLEFVSELAFASMEISLNDT